MDNSVAPLLKKRHKIRTDDAIKFPKDSAICMLAVQRSVLAWLTVNILIEDADTLEFLAGDGKWTKIASEGKCFPATRFAFQTAKQEPISRFNIVSFIPQSGQFINLDHGRGKGPAVAL